VVLEVDRRSGLIRVPSDTPLKFEKIPVRSLNPDLTFKRGEKVLIRTVKQGIFLVDNGP